MQKQSLFTAVPAKTRACIYLLCTFGMIGCGQQPIAPSASASAPYSGQTGGTSQLTEPDLLTPVPNPKNAADRIVNGAKEEARRGVLYDASYKRIAYPGGDVARDRGACTDVLIRALRNAGIDLQQRIHEDMRAHFALYPPRKDLSRPDTNIDHRRVANHLVFMRRHGQRLPIETTGDALKTWLPGDLVYWKLSSGLDHCGVVSNVRNADGLPLVIHNLGRAAQEDCLTAFKIVAHYRYPK
jgi:uncharacterized protein